MNWLDNLIKKEITRKFEPVDSQLSEVQRDIKKIRSELINLREDIDISMSQLTKLIDKRLELLGDKKGLVTELLKKIAKLED